MALNLDGGASYPEIEQPYAGVCLPLDVQLLGLHIPAAVRDSRIVTARHHDFV